RGFRIELGEIEAQLGRLADEVVVMAREDAPGDRRLVAYYTGEASEQQLREQALQALPGYMVPAAYVKLEALPLTPNGKIDRKALPAPGDAEASRPAYVAPVTATEAALCEIWQDLLGTRRVGTTDNFFQLGGHSILVIRMLAIVNKRFDVNLTVATVFDKTDCASLGAHIDRLAALGRKPPVEALAGQEQYVEGEL
ncbi:MAG TPA: phosphopantetheine-binding protein, partial [Paucimonas sp.]|nr:phosphopantetheine-binding protein [Paucimonas sp.]